MIVTFSALKTAAERENSKGKRAQVRVSPLYDDYYVSKVKAVIGWWDEVFNTTLTSPLIWLANKCPVIQYVV